MNKSQGRTKRAQREQTSLFGAAMHDSSRRLKLVVLQPEQGNVAGTPFLAIKLWIKKRKSGDGR